MKCMDMGKARYDGVEVSVAIKIALLQSSMLNTPMSLYRVLVSLSEATCESRLQVHWPQQNEHVSTRVLSVSFLTVYSA